MNAKFSVTFPAGYGINVDDFAKAYLELSGDEVTDFEVTDSGVNFTIPDASDPNDYSILMNTVETLSTFVGEETENMDISVHEI